MKSRKAVFGWAFGLAAVVSLPIAAQQTGRIAEIPEISPEINSGRGPAGGQPNSAPPTTRSVRCGDGFCSAGESAASCPVDCPGAYGACGSANNTLVDSFPTGTAACDPGQATTQNGDGVGNDGTYNWYCLGASGGSPECMARRAVQPACGAANNTGVMTYPTGSSACATGTQSDIDSAGTDGRYDWNCVGINTPATAQCQATNLAAPPVCRSYTGTYASEPATNDATGCDRGTFSNAADTSDTWNWTCRNPNTGVSVNCSAMKPAPVIDFSGTPTSVTLGSTVSLTWSALYATSCSSGRDWGVAGKAVSGSETITPSPAGTRVYRLTCSNDSGSTFRDVTITVSSSAPTPAPTPAPTLGPPRIDSFTADRSTVTSGDAISLSWSTTNVTGCVAGGQWSGPKGSAGIANGVFPSTPPPGSRTYNLTCGNGSGQNVSASVVVNYVDPPSVTIAANPTSISLGSSTTLTWSTNAWATSCTASATAGAGSWSGAKSTGNGQSLAVSPTTSGTKTYTLTCYNAAATSRSTSATVTVGSASSTPAPTPATNACGVVGAPVSWGPSNYCTGVVPNDPDGHWPILVRDTVSSGNGYTGQMTFNCSGNTSSYTLYQDPRPGDGCTPPTPTPQPTPTTPTPTPPPTTPTPQPAPTPTPTPTPTPPPGAGCTVYAVAGAVGQTTPTQNWRWAEDGGPSDGEDAQRKGMPYQPTNTDLKVFVTTDRAWFDAPQVNGSRSRGRLSLQANVEHTGGVIFSMIRNRFHDKGDEDDAWRTDILARCNNGAITLSTLKNDEPTSNSDRYTNIKNRDREVYLGGEADDDNTYQAGMYATIYPAGSCFNVPTLDKIWRDTSSGLVCEGTRPGGDSIRGGDYATVITPMSNRCPGRSLRTRRPSTRCRESSGSSRWTGSSICSPDAWTARTGARGRTRLSPVRVRRDRGGRRRLRGGGR
ncbi:hypothetical protein AAG565_15575 [Fontimonas sp. SYSU GA230001]|uniref:hypothetical protein n=1 Tax=Fontimonas sp. SYSU GA230001 TaxID=3142450 RepID=UPI0032B4A8B4